MLRKLGIPLGGLILAAFFVWFTMRWFQGKMLGEAAIQLLRSPGMLVLMTVGYGLSFWLKALAWRLYAGREKIDPLRHYIHPLFVSLLINHVLPVKAGDLARTGLFVRSTSLRWDAALHSVGAMRVLDMASLLLIGSVGALVLGLETSPWYIVLLGIGTLTTAAVWFGLERLWRRVQREKRAFAKDHEFATIKEGSTGGAVSVSAGLMMQDRAEQIHDDGAAPPTNEGPCSQTIPDVSARRSSFRGRVGTCKVGRMRAVAAFALRHYDHLRATLTSKRGALAALLTFACWLLEGSVVYGVAQALDLSVNPLQAVWVTGMTIAGQIFHVTPGGIGTYETTLTASLGVLGVAGSAAYTAALVSHGYKFVFAYVTGTISIVMTAVTWTELRGWLRLRRREGQGE